MKMVRPHGCPGGVLTIPRARVHDCRTSLSLPEWGGCVFPSALCLMKNGGGKEGWNAIEWKSVRQYSDLRFKSQTSPKTPETLPSGDSVGGGSPWPPNKALVSADVRVPADTARASGYFFLKLRSVDAGPQGDSKTIQNT